MKLLAVILNVLFLLAFSSEDVPDFDKAVLLVSKTTSPAYIVVGKPMNIAVTIYNLGKQPARDVLVIDSSLAPEDFIFIEGDIDQQVDEIPGGSNVSMKFSVLPMRSGSFPENPVIISYLDNTHDSPQRANSMPTSVSFKVLSDEEYYQQVEDHLGEWIIFCAASLILVSFPSYKYYLARRAAREAKLF